MQGDQTLTDGQTVKLRLLEPMRVSGRVIPRNTLLVGAARLQGERLGIGIISLEHGGNIIPVELEVYDSDGQAGIFIPGSMEIDAAKARKQHQHIDRRGGAARLRSGSRGDTGHLAVHFEKDAHGKGTSEIGIQGAAVSGKGMNSPKT